MPTTPQIAYYEDNELVDEAFEIELKSNVHLRKKDLSGRVVSRMEDVIHQRIHVLPPHDKLHQEPKKQNIKKSVSYHPEKKMITTALQINTLKVETKDIGTSQFNLKTLTPFPTQTSELIVSEDNLQPSKSIDYFTDSFVQTFWPEKEEEDNVNFRQRVSLYTATPDFIQTPGLSMHTESKKVTLRKTKLKQINPDSDLFYARILQPPKTNHNINILNNHQNTTNNNNKKEYKKICCNDTNNNNMNDIENTVRISKNENILKPKAADRMERLARKEMDELLRDDEVSRILKSTSSFGSFFRGCQMHTTTTTHQMDKKAVTTVKKITSDLSCTSTIDLDIEESRHEELRVFLRGAFDEFC